MLEPIVLFPAITPPPKALCCLDFPTNFYRQEFMMRRLYKCGNAMWVLLRITLLKDI